MNRNLWQELQILNLLLIANTANHILRQSPWLQLMDQIKVGTTLDARKSSKPLHINLYLKTQSATLMTSEMPLIFIIMAKEK